jgi:hypothetical protein
MYYKRFCVPAALIGALVLALTGCSLEQEGGGIVPVTGITGNLPGSITVGNAVNLNSLVTVEPENATYKTIVWSVANPDSFGVTAEAVAGGAFTPTAVGTMELTATIAKGKGEEDFVKSDYRINLVSRDSLIPVTGIAGELPARIDLGVEIYLNGYVTVEPEDASNKRILWSIADPGSFGLTEDSVKDGRFTPTLAGDGTMELTATIAAGTATGDFVKTDYRITVIGVTEPGEPPVGQEPEEPSVVEPEVQGIIVNSASNSIMAKGEVRKFTARAEGAGDVLQDPVWTVEGASADGGTIINKNGQLKIGAYETSITLRVRAASPANPDVWGSVAVKVQGWKTLNLGGLFPTRDGGVQGIAYGNGIWVMAGASLVTPNPKPPNETWTDMAWSTDGITWNTTSSTSPLRRARDNFWHMTYDGPEGNKRFLIGTQMGSMAISSNGKTWSMTQNIFKNPWAISNSGSSPIWSITYGVVQVDGVDTGLYVAGGAMGNEAAVAWSRDGAAWDTTTIAALENGIPRVVYGTGTVQGVKTRMFLINNEAASAYSVDGALWTPLSEAEETALAFTPADKPQTSWTEKTTSTDITGNPWDSSLWSSSKTKCIARGGPAGSEIYIAVGPGNTAAYAHAE